MSPDNATGVALAEHVMHIITMDSEIWISSSTSTLCLVFHVSLA